ncbi:MAG: 1-acyl-sn-glycerol-3-phosphate acyltransferase [Sandaracinaceae bacterium]
MGVLFFMFFCGSPFIALVVFPTLRLVSGKEAYRRRCTRLLYLGMALICWLGRGAGIWVFQNPVLPPRVDPDQSYVLISNHPTFIDMIVLLGSIPRLTCVTSGRWSRHWALGRLLRSTEYLPGPGSGRPESEDMLGSMVRHLQAGHSLLVFPEGQRSQKDQLRRFRRGAFEAAAQANVPLVPLFLGIDRPYLTKEVSIWNPPTPSPEYTFDWFEVVEPAEYDNDGRRIHEHLVSQYRARFEEQRALQKSLAEG